MPATGSSVPAPSARRIAVGGGVALHCVTWAPRARGLPFVLLHGLASNGRTWEAVARHLAFTGHPVTAIDLRGHGRSDKPGDGYDLATLGDDVLAVLGGLGHRRPVVVGQSMGGNIAIDLARRAGDRLAGAGGVDGGLIELSRRWPDWEACAEALAPPRWDRTRPEDLEARLRRDFPSWSDWGVEATMASFGVTAAGAVQPHLGFDRHLRLLRALWEHRPSVFLGDVAVPVLLVLAGEPDGDGLVARSSARQAAAALARARVHHLPHADHDVHVQQPHRVAALLAEAAADGFFDGSTGRP